MKIRQKFFDFEFEQVLDIKARELIRVACAIPVVTTLDVESRT